MGGRKKGIEKEKDGGLETKFERAGGGEERERQREEREKERERGRGGTRTGGGKWREGRSFRW